MRTNAIYPPRIFPGEETHKLLWDFEIQTHRLISARRPDLVIVNKKENLRVVDFAVLLDHRVKSKESENWD